MLCFHRKSIAQSSTRKKKSLEEVVEEVQSMLEIKPDVWLQLVLATGYCTTIFLFTSRQSHSIATTHCFFGHWKKLDSCAFQESSINITNRLGRMQLSWLSHHLIEHSSFLNDDNELTRSILCEESVMVIQLLVLCKLAVSHFSRHCCQRQERNFIDQRNTRRSGIIRGLRDLYLKKWFVSVSHTGRIFPTHLRVWAMCTLERDGSGGNHAWDPIRWISYWWCR